MVNNYTVRADDFLSIVQAHTNGSGQTWVEAGGHMHANHDLTAGIALVSSPFRHPQFPLLTERYGEGQAGRVQLYEDLYQAMESGLDLFALYGDQALNDELKLYLNKTVANAFGRAVYGEGLFNTALSMAFGSSVNTWKDQYLARTCNGDGPYTSGALYLVRFHLEFEPYGSLDSTCDRVSPILHNSSDGISNQGANFYSQWVHFLWHDMQVPFGMKKYPYAVYNPGNSLHPSSDFFMNSLESWARGGLAFDLEATQQNPTQHFRQARLQD
jgi:hypothetical protein